MDRPWLKPLLWQIWRAGGLGQEEAILRRFLRSHQLNPNVLDALCVQGWLTTGIRPPDIAYTLTEKGMDSVMEDESKVWRTRLEGLTYKDPENTLVQMAITLRDRHVTYALIDDVIGKNSHKLIDNHEFTVKQNARVNREIQNFLGGADFRSLSILVLFNGSTVLVNALQESHIYHLWKLLSHRASDLVKLKKIGATHLHRIKKRLAEFDEYLEP